MAVAWHAGLQRGIVPRPRTLDRADGRRRRAARAHRTLVDAAQHHGYEACYGAVLVHFEDGHECELGDFPPRPGGMQLQATVYHSRLPRFIHSELIDTLFGESNDWSKIRRMMRLGIYIGMTDEIVTDKIETNRTLADYGWLTPRAVR